VKTTEDRMKMKTLSALLLGLLVASCGGAADGQAPMAPLPPPVLEPSPPATPAPASAPSQHHKTP
jgi:hypothetical protein